MIKSMTGFGISSTLKRDYKYSIEINSVNGRFFETKFKGTQLDLSFENKIKKIIKNKLCRGTVYIRFDLDSAINNKITFDQEKYELLKSILRDIHVRYGQPMNMSDIISSSDLLKLTEQKLPDEQELIKCVELALNQLDDMRKVEGEKILEDILKRVKRVQKIIKLIEKKVNSYKFEKQDKLRLKVKDLLNGEDVDESRLIQEVAYYIEKMDVTEEIVRCMSHFNQLISFLESNEPVGKRINFLLQEIGREINTIGSKSTQTEVIVDIVEIKDEVEKMREQIQNIL
mgnify:FL=1